jgi:predicted amidohydrolase YtcJ
LVNRPTALREAHAHIAAHGREMSFINLAACASREECLDRLAAEARGLGRPGDNGWLMAAGARVEGWREPVWPTAAELDKAAGERPCCVMSFDHHAVAANSAAMKAAGIGDGTPDPHGGVIVRDPHTGRPTGVMLEAAAKQVWNAAPEPTAADRKAHLRAGLKDLVGLGFVEIHDLLSPPWLGQALAELDDAGELQVTAWVYPTVADVEQVAAGRSLWERKRVKLAGAKLFADGTLNSRTAWMLDRYLDPLPGLESGKAMIAAGEIERAMELTGRLGIGLAVHAIGDRAVREVLDAWERVGARAGQGPDPQSLRAAKSDAGWTPAPKLRIEHAEIIDEADIPRFAAMGVVCSMQPCHLLYDIEALNRSLPHRLHRVLPLQDLIQAGCRPGELLWFGSDVPIVRPQPEDSVIAATLRQRKGMKEGQAIAPEQAIEEEQAWAAFAPAPS